jgi:hypothetical protein
VLHEALGEAVLKDHSGVLVEHRYGVACDGEQGQDATRVPRRVAGEHWDAPVVGTTRHRASTVLSAPPANVGGPQAA